MTGLATACPKPMAAVKVRLSLRDQQAAKLRALSPAERQARFAAQRPRKPLPRGTKQIPQVNVQRQARRLKGYRAHLRSPYFRALRVQAYARDGGLCWCPECVQGRRDGVAEAFEPIDVWFDTKGGIHGFDTHHTTYARFGRELLSDVLTMKPRHHRALEAKTGFRRRFLSQRRAS